jgi:ribose transport system substrate-binding protein
VSGENHYVVQSVVNALGVLSAFRSQGESLRLKEIVERTGFNRCMCFRLLYTLHHCGFLEKTDASRYRLSAERPCDRRFRLGFSCRGQDSGFAQEVLASLFRVARSQSLEIVTAETGSGRSEGVDLVLEFHVDSAKPGAAQYETPSIPIIAIDIPQPGAIYFGVNHYEAGLTAGRHLGRWATGHWGGGVDELLLVELDSSASITRSRARGIMAGMEETLPGAGQLTVSTIDGAGRYGTSLDAVRRWLRRARAKRILIAATNDASALGALRALEEAGRGNDCAIVGQNAEPEARMELREPRTGLIGSVACPAEEYGEGLVRLALDILTQKPVPQASFVKHRIVTRDNVDRFYPNDQFLDPASALGAGPRPVVAIHSKSPRAAAPPRSGPRARTASSH